MAWSLWISILNSLVSFKRVLTYENKIEIDTPRQVGARKDLKCRARAPDTTVMGRVLYN